jgi:hypothetical protein
MADEIQNKIEDLIQKVAIETTTIEAEAENLSEDTEPALTENQQELLDYLAEYSDDFIAVGNRYYEDNKSQITYNDAEIEQETLDLYEEDPTALETVDDYRENILWSNHIKNCAYTPARTYNKAKSILAIQDVVRQAKSNGAKVRFMGNGHSYSTITEVSEQDYIILPKYLNRVLGKDDAFALLKKDVNDKYTLLEDPNADCYFETESGVSIAKLNEKLYEAEKALKTMGSWSAQTILGVISSSTHGSRHDMGPIPDMVKSILIVARDGQLLRIEPNNGITNPIKHDAVFAQEGNTNPIELIQNDLYFYSVLVNMACMGVVYSVVIEVDTAHKLEESRKASVLEYELAKLKENHKEYMSKDRTIDYNLLVNPYRKINGQFTCVRTRRMETDKTDIVLKGEGKRSFWLVCATTCNLLSTISSKCLTSAKGWREVRNLLKTALKAMDDKDNYVDQSDKVFITPRPKNIEGLALEMILPFKYTEEAIYHTLGIIAELGKRKGRYKRLISAPLSIRFVGKSDAYLSPFTACNPDGPDADTELFVCIEIPCLLKTKGWEYTLNTIQNRMLAKYKYRLRMHWGLNFGTLDSSNYKLSERYPQLENWLEVYNDLNQFKVFSNKFTQQMGFDNPINPLS